eukprot:tig00020816_g14180.t1
MEAAAPPETKEEKPKVSMPVERRGRRAGGSSDSFNSFIKEVGSFELLSAEEEIELSRQIRDLVQLETVKKRLAARIGREPREDEWAMAAGTQPGPAFQSRILKGRRARARLVQSNLRWVVSIAKKYANKHTMPLQDLIQEGSIGLMKAAERFDPDKGFKFLTYATWWIRQAIFRSLQDQGRTIRLPVHVHDSLYLIKKTRQQLASRLGRIPTPEELADELNIPVSRLAFITQAASLPISLESPISANKFDEARNNLGDFIESECLQPDEQLERTMLREDLENVLATLKARERDIIRMRYGLVDGSPKTLNEIGEIVGLTRERIRQIEQSAMRKLKAPYRKAILCDYIGQEFRRFK